jgi:hypothetical protein
VRSPAGDLLAPGEEQLQLPRDFLGEASDPGIAGLPKLKGTQKQLLWAEQLRRIAFIAEREKGDDLKHFYRENTAGYWID